MGGAEHARPARPSRAGESEHATTVQTLRSEEAVRASGFGRTILVLCVASIAFVPFLPAAPWLRNAMVATVVVVGAVAGWVWIQAARPGRYTPFMFRVFGVFGVFAVLMTLYYSGVFSTGAVIVMLGIFFFGQGDDRPWALGLTIAAVVVYVVLGVLITVGVLPELGLMRGLAMPLSVRIFAIAMVPYIFGITIWQARLSRRATFDAVQRLGAALRAVQEREALLQEANQNFDAMVAAGGGHGGYSGRQAGKYLLGDVIGRGGMGEVYAATHVESGVRAAVKLLNPTALADYDLFQRFLREADILRCLSAPNLISVYDVGQMAGAPYIAMELLEGHDLAWSLRHAQKLALGEVIDLAEQVARGLDSAHEAGIVHRDLKPQNLFRTESSATWKVLDFGVAKLLGSDGTLTRGAIVGTPGYMSPEQARGGDADLRADIVSLGAVLYRVTTGRPPFAGNDVPEAIFQVVFGMPERPSELAPGLPRDVDDVLAIALAKRAEDRFSGATELAQAFRAATEGRIGSELRVRASRILEQIPWGHRARDASLRTTAHINRSS
jgi:serine/threonine-protein kinase